jgi:hypothetical protein
VKLSSRHISLSLAVGLLVATAAVAHHSTAMFDMQRTLKISGVVTRFDWTNPHTFIWLDVGDGAETKVEYSIEGMSPNYLSRNGWSHSTLKAGDRVTLEIHPLKDGRKGGFCATVTLPDGTVLRNLPGPPPSAAPSPPPAP